MSGTGLRTRPTSHRPKFGGMSTAMLRGLLGDTLDPGYAEAARRRAERAAGADPPLAEPARRPAWVLVAAVLAVAGLLLGVAYQNTRGAQPDATRARAGLLADVHAKQQLTDGLEAKLQQLKAIVGTQRDTLLASTAEGQQATNDVQALEYAAAQQAVTGPGVQVTIGDSPQASGTDPLGGAQVVVDDGSLIHDRDLQDVVNALWAAGAEAIAINGHRLSPLTAIRAAGDAILVDLRPVTSPYVVRALGDPKTLLPRFADTTVARRYLTYISLYGIRFEGQTVASLTLPSASGALLSFARPLPPGSAPSASDSSLPPQGGGS